MTVRRVPELSLLSYINGTSSDKVKFVDQLFSGIKDYGFIILVDHPLRASLVKEAYQVVEQFFDLTTEQKMQYICPEGGGQRGYTAFGTEHAKYSNVPDLKEFWHVGREVADDHKWRKFYPPNMWPTELPKFKAVMSEIYEQLDSTSGILLQALGQALDVPQNYFSDMIDLGNSILRPIHYPPVAANVPAGSVRSAAHEDINLITILMGATSSGLELLDRDGKWLAVETKEGQLVVDSGDMLSRITNEVIPATTHRVVNPPESTSKRYSMPFFVHPNPETTLQCIPSCIGSGEKYAPINGHEFLMQRLKEIGLVAKK